jgi:hypothetical protein
MRTPGMLAERGVLKLLGPDGTILAAPPNALILVPGNIFVPRHHRYARIDDFLIPASGTYTVEVTTSHRYIDGQGNYFLGIGTVSDPVSLSMTGTTTAAFGVRGSRPVWEIQGMPRQALHWEYAGNQKLRSWSVAGPDGTHLTGGTGSTISFIPTVRGTYRLTLNADLTVPWTSRLSLGPFSYSLTGSEENHNPSLGDIAVSSPTRAGTGTLAFDVVTEGIDDPVVIALYRSADETFDQGDDKLSEQTIFHFPLSTFHYPVL